MLKSGQVVDPKIFRAWSISTRLIECRTGVGSLEVKTKISLYRFKVNHCEWLRSKIIRLRSVI